MLTQSQIAKAKLVSQYAQAYCLKMDRMDVKPAELLPFLVEKRFFNKIDSRNGRDLRELLRTLDDEDRLDLIPQVSVDRKEKNRFWYFHAVGDKFVKN